MAAVLYGMGEYYAEAVADLATILAMPLGESPCPWFTQEECLTQAVRAVVNMTTVGCRTEGGRVGRCGHVEA